MKCEVSGKQSAEPQLWRMYYDVEENSYIQLTGMVISGASVINPEKNQP
jgi:hypothetical protein